MIPVEEAAELETAILLLTTEDEELTPTLLLLATEVEEPGIIVLVLIAELGLWPEVELGFELKAFELGIEEFASDVVVKELPEMATGIEKIEKIDET